MLVFRIILICVLFRLNSHVRADIAWRRWKAHIHTTHTVHIHAATDKGSGSSGLVEPQPFSLAGINVPPARGSRSRAGLLIICILFMFGSLIGMHYMDRIQFINPSASAPDTAPAAASGGGGAHAFVEIESMQLSEHSSAPSHHSHSHSHASASKHKQFQFVTIALLGPPGVGKSALSRHLGPYYNFAPLSTGNLIRAEIKAGSVLGKKISSIVNAGGLVEDEIVLQLVENELTRLFEREAHLPPLNRTRGVIFDGFPRRLSQCQLLSHLPPGIENIPPLAAVISVDMPDTILAERRAGRRVCPSCGASYNLHAIQHDGYDLRVRAPKDGIHCDKDGSVLVSRPDDEESVANQRMTIFHQDNVPMVEYYKSLGILIEAEKRQGAKHVFIGFRRNLTRLIQEFAKEYYGHKIDYLTKPERDALVPTAHSSALAHLDEDIDEDDED